MILTFSLVIVNALKSNVRLECSNAVCSNFKRYSCYKTREKGCMDMIVCERFSGNIIVFIGQC